MRTKEARLKFLQGIHLPEGGHRLLGSNKPFIAGINGAVARLRLSLLHGDRSSAGRLKGLYW
jgi:hypothetical protein